MDKTLVIDFYNCGDNELINFAVTRAHLNRHEQDVLHYMLDECLTQEQTAERMNYSVRRVQQFWQSACKKLLSISWVEKYSLALRILH